MAFGNWRRRWGTDFGFEPLNVYQEKERERAKDLVRAASREKYGTEMPPLPYLPIAVARQAVQTAREAPAKAPYRAAAQTAFSVTSHLLGFGAPRDVAADRALVEAEGRHRVPMGDLSLLSDEQVSRLADSIRETKATPTLQKVWGSVEPVVSGNRFVRDLTKGNVDLSRLPGPLADVTDAALAPATLLTAGLGGGAAAAGRIGAGVGGKAAARTITGSILKRFGQETAAGAVGNIAGREAAERLPEGTPGPVKLGVGLGAGVVAGGLAFKSPELPRRTARTGVLPNRSASLDVPAGTRTFHGSPRPIEEDILPSKGGMLGKGRYTTARGEPLKEGEFGLNQFDRSASGYASSVSRRVGPSDALGRDFGEQYGTADGTGMNVAPVRTGRPTRVFNLGGRMTVGDLDELVAALPEKWKPVAEQVKRRLRMHGGVFEDTPAMVLATLVDAGPGGASQKLLRRGGERFNYRTWADRANKFINPMLRKAGYDGITTDNFLSEVVWFDDVDLVPDWEFRASRPGEVPADTPPDMKRMNRAWPGANLATNRWDTTPNLGRLPNALDTAKVIGKEGLRQTAPEAIGAGLSVAANEASGREMDPWEAALWGALAGRGARYFTPGAPGSRALARIQGRAGREPAFGMMIDIEHPAAAAYEETLARNRIPYSLDADGTIHIDDPEAALEIADALEAEGLSGLMPKTTGGRSSSPYYKDVWGEHKKVTFRQRGGVVPNFPDPQQQQALLDADRIRETVDPNMRVRPDAEDIRTVRWADDATPGPRFRDVLDDEAKKQLMRVYDDGKTTRAGQEAARRLGRGDAHKVVARAVRGATPQEAAWELRAEILHASLERTGNAKRLSTYERAYLEALEEAELEILAEGSGFVDNVGRAGSGNVSEARPGGADVGATGVRGEDSGTPPRAPIEEATGIGTGTAGPPTPRRVDLEGNVTDTFQTEAELAGIRPQQGDLLDRGDADAARGAFERGAGGQDVGTADALVGATPASMNLPPQLAGAKPRYSYGRKQFTLSFESDTDMALYIVAQARKSRRDADYMAFLREAMPGRSDTELRQLGEAVRSRIKVKAKGAPAGQLRVEAGAHELGEVERIADPRPFPRSVKSPDGQTVTDIEYTGNQPRRAADMPLPGEVGEGQVPRMQPTGLRSDGGAFEAGDTVVDRGTREIFEVVGPGDNDAQLLLRNRETGEEVLRLKSRLDRTSAARGAEGQMGGPPPQEPGIPEAPPPAEPPPPTEPGPGNPQMPLGSGEPFREFLDAKPRDELIAKATGKRSIKDRVRGKTPDARVTAVKTELERVAQTAHETVDEQADNLRFQAEAVGLRAKQGADGQWVLDGFSKEVPLGDVVEQATDDARAVYAELSEPQRAVIDEIRRIREGWNKTIEAHGGTVPKTETASGEMFPRRVIGREVESGMVEKNKSGGGRGRRLGGAREHTRTQESMAAGIEEGIVYDNPWNAFKDAMHNKAAQAIDQHIVNLIEPLAVKEAKSGFGYRALSGDHPALTRNRAVGTAFDGENVVVQKEPLIFENDVADALDDVLSSPSILHSKPGKAIQAINAVTSPVRAAMDISFFGNQGLGLVESSPTNAAKGIKGGVEVVRSAMGDPQRYAALRTAERTRGTALLREAGIDGVPAGEWLRRRGVHYAGEGNIGEFQFPEFMQKIPGLGKGLTWSNETFGRFLNYARDVLATDELERAVKSGLKGADLERHMDEASDAINRMTGWTRSNPTGLESIALFAPRFFRSNAIQIAKAVSDRGLEGQIARRHLFRMAAIGSATVFAVNSARGYNTDIDPRSDNFMRFRDIAGRDVSPFGPFATIIRAAAQGVAGEAGEMSDEPKGRGIVFGTNKPKPAPMDSALRLARGKASPLAGTVWSLLTGENYQGEPFDFNSPEHAAEAALTVGKEAFPFSVQALAEEGPLGFAASATGLQSTSMTPSEKRDIARQDVAQRRFGVDYRELSGEDKATVNQDPRVKEQADAALQRGLDREDMGATIRQEFQSKMEANGRFFTAGKDDSGKPFTGTDYRKAYDDAVAARMNQMKGAGIDIEGDPVVDGYFALYDQAKMANGQTDYDKFDRLVADYIAKHPDAQERVAKSVGVNDDPTMQKLRRARAQAKEFYDIPAYRGFTNEDADRATEVIGRANALAGAGVAPGQRAALIMLRNRGDITQEDVTLAIRAQRAGANPERRAFLADHPEFVMFYKGVSEADAAAAGGPRGSSGGGGGSFMPKGFGSGGSSRRFGTSRQTASSGGSSRFGGGRRFGR